MAADGEPVAQIGPNALTQTARALVEAAGDAQARALLARAGLLWLLERPPTTMVPEASFQQLAQLLIDNLGSERASAVLQRSGALTCEYLLRKRIPYPFQRLLQGLPRALRLRLWLAAIKQHAWTFAGSGRFSYTIGGIVQLQIEHRAQVADPVYSFYRGTFCCLLRALVDPALQLRQQIHRHTRGSACVYTLTFCH